MKKTTVSIIVAAITFAAAGVASAGGYHCKLKIKEFKITAERGFSLKVEKVEADRAMYKGKLGDWQMVGEEIGEEFTLIFDIEKFDAKALRCVNFMILAFKEGRQVEFGFGDTAIKKDGEGRYVSNLLDTWHENRAGEPCVHGS